MKNLFENLWNAKTTEELQELQKHFSDMDSWYIKHCVSKDNESQKFIDFVNSIYHESFPYLDKNFPKELRRKWKFISRLWELYLVSFLRKRWYNILCDKEESFNPDIKMEVGWSIVRVECVASSKWTGKDKLEEIPEWISWWYIDDIDMPRKLRLTSVIVDKQNKYQKYLENYRINKKDPFIIAINWWESYGDMINNGIESILYGFWKTYYTKPYHNNKLEWPFLESKLFLEKWLWKIKVPNDLFLKPEFKGISGVIFFWSCLVSSNDYSLEGINNNWYSLSRSHRLIFIRNAFAINQVPDWFLKDFEKKVIIW